MRITIAADTIVATRWYGIALSASAQDVTHVRVMADRLPDLARWYWRRPRATWPESDPSRRTIIIWAGERAVVLDAWLDEGFDAAAAWLERIGWDMASAWAEAVETPLVRVTVERTRDGESSATWVTHVQFAGEQP